MKCIHLLLLAASISMLLSCDRCDTKNVVKHWLGRKVEVVGSKPFLIAGHLPQDINEDFVIVSYVDSLGCVSCKLALKKWGSVSAAIDSATHGHVPVVFIVEESLRRKMSFMLKADHFAPDCIVVDSANVLNERYRFPDENEYQTFLLNKERNVIAIGSPVHNEKVMDLFIGAIVKQRKAGAKAQ